MSNHFHYSLGMLQASTTQVPFLQFLHLAYYSKSRQDHDRLPIHDHMPKRMNVSLIHNDQCIRKWHWFRKCMSIQILFTLHLSAIPTLSSSENSHSSEDGRFVVMDVNVQTSSWNSWNSSWNIFLQLLKILLKNTAISGKKIEDILCNIIQLWKPI